MNIMNKDMQTRLEAIQQENPAMNAITIATEQTETGERQYFNIVDLQGKPHTFFNDTNIDVLDIYDGLKAKSKKQVTPNQLIGAINRKIHEVRVGAVVNTEETKAVEVPKVVETKPALLFEEEEIPEIFRPNAQSQEMVPVKKVVKKEEPVVHTPEMVEPILIPKQPPIQQQVENDPEVQEIENRMNSDISKLIPISEFYRILDVGAKMDAKTRMAVNLWYAYFGELMIYEDFLNVELKDILNGFRNYVVALQISDNVILNVNQVEACDRLYDLEENKHNYVIGQGQVNTNEKTKANVLTYSLKDNAAFVAYVQIFAIVFSIATILSALVIYVVSK